MCRFGALSWGTIGDGRLLMMSSDSSASSYTLGGENTHDFYNANPLLIGSGALPATLPTCGADCDLSTSTIAVDQTGYVPCTGTQESVWFECMNPMMEALFPQYTTDDSTIPSTPFRRPMPLFTTVPDIKGLKNSKPAQWPWFRWTQYATMTHYCATFNQHRLPEDNNSGWRPGAFLKCDNDPMSYNQRLQFCQDTKPWWVLTGNVLVTLSLEDICPFIGTDDSPYCVVFSDHPQYPTVRSLLSATLPKGKSWNGVRFYYAPYTMKAMKYVMMNPSVINTLFTNSVDAGVGVESPQAGLPIPLTSKNKDTFSPTITYFARELFKTDSTTLDPFCDDNAVIPLSAFRAMYDLVQGYRNPNTGDYDMPSTISNSNDRITLKASDVEPTFLEINTALDYSDLVLTSLVPGVRVVIGHTSSVVVNSIVVCTRYQINGENIVIHGLTLDQGDCSLVDVLRQTPIVFSGRSGVGSEIYDVTVIDSAAAVAVLGGDDLMYRAYKTTNANGMLIYNISFE